MIFKLELSPQNFHYDVLYPLYSAFTEICRIIYIQGVVLLPYLKFETLAST